MDTETIKIAGEEDTQTSYQDTQRDIQNNLEELLRTEIVLEGCI